MKSLIMSLILMGAALNGRAEAGTFYALLTPDNAVAYPGYPSLHGCGADSFNADDTANGLCYRSQTTACSGRYCQPTVYTEYFSVAWNTDGSVDLSLPCGTRKHHNPQADVWTYQPGYNASNCHSPILTSNQTTTIDGVTYAYFATSLDGLYELIRGNNIGPAIYQF